MVQLKIQDPAGLMEVQDQAGPLQFRSLGQNRTGLTISTCDLGSDASPNSAVCVRSQPRKSLESYQVFITKLVAILQSIPSINPALRETSEPDRPSLSPSRPSKPRPSHPSVRPSVHPSCPVRVLEPLRDMGDVNANAVPTQADINAQLMAGQAQLTATMNAVTEQLARMEQRNRPNDPLPRRRNPPYLDDPRLFSDEDNEELLIEEMVQLKIQDPAGLMEVQDQAGPLQFRSLGQNRTGLTISTCDLGSDASPNSAVCVRSQPRKSLESYQVFITKLVAILQSIPSINPALRETSVQQA
ncbi:hypothetical protein IGI04_019060 [Brassica rapa subsp. trilocularis]|uniref:Uncharacterized protein n=1 Tax=Brassica rapa subsp. trilocularis TaxID=1813537 RepID=A0ABQ7MER8_BRACM|nr:hypothetical protein IGI04_019060 [Brassica rapa subsp. trilocularis]